MDKTHDTFADLPRGTPGWFTLSARLLPLGLLAQFLSAGTALFHDGALWGLHGAVGGALSLPVFALSGGALLLQRLNGFGWWAGLTTLLYLGQIALAADLRALRKRQEADKIEEEALAGLVSTLGPTHVHTQAARSRTRPFWDFEAQTT